MYAFDDSGGPGRSAHRPRLRSALDAPVPHDGPGAFISIIIVIITIVIVIIIFTIVIIISSIFIICLEGTKGVTRTGGRE